MKRRTALLVVWSAAAPFVLAGQGLPGSFFDRVFKSVTDGNLYVISGSLTKPDNFLMGHGLRGVGLELSFDLGHQFFGKNDCVKTGPQQLEQPAPTVRCHYLNSALAVGYSQVAGILGRGIDLRASMEQLPNLSYYATYHTSEHAMVLPYVGGRVGFTQLKGMRVIVSGTSGPARGSGSTYHLGYVAGVAVESRDHKLAGFVEYARTYARLQSIDWAASGGLPPSLLGNIKLDTQTWAVGVEIGLGAPYGHQ